MKKILAITRARNLEFWRDYANVAFTFLLPFAVIIGFKYGAESDQVIYHITYVNEVPNNFENFKSIQAVTASKKYALDKLKHQKTDLVVNSKTSELWFNSGVNSSESAKRLFKNYRHHSVSASGIRQLDWLFPGILIMNLMFTCIYGIGFGIVRYRITGVLKRFYATPMRAAEFMLGQMLSRLLIILAGNTVIYCGGVYLLGIKSAGSEWLVLLIMTLGAFNMMSLGMLVASQTKSEEVIESLINTVTLPMLFLTGMYFSLDSMEPAIQTLSDWLPLTQLTSSLRSVMLENAGIAEIAPQLVFVLLTGVLFLTLASLLFRWRN